MKVRDDDISEGEGKCVFKFANKGWSDWKKGIGLSSNSSYSSSEDGGSVDNKKDARYSGEDYGNYDYIDDCE